MRTRRHGGDLVFAAIVTGAAALAAGAGVGILEERLVPAQVEPVVLAHLRAQRSQP